MASSHFYTQYTLPHLKKPTLPNVETPKTIGPFVIEGLLKQNHLNVIYLGHHPDKQEPLAIKVLSPSLLANEQMKEQFLHESKIIELADHPNIIKYFSEGVWEDGLFIATEFVQGVSLKQFIVKQHLTLESVLKITLQVCYALLHLHSHGIIHRDLKPENVIITEEGTVKVIDFGIALVQGVKGGLSGGRGEFIGTPHYMSLEQKTDPSLVTPASDIYSLGVILYELLLGKLSLGHLDLNLLPNGVKEIVTKAVQPNLQNRYQDIAEMIHDLSDLAKFSDQAQESPVDELSVRLKKACADLAPIKDPSWPQFQISSACQYGDSGLYYDTFHLDDNSFLLFIAEAPGHIVDSSLTLTYLKGLIKSALAPFKSGGEATFDLSDFLIHLNSIFSQNEEIHREVAITLLHMIPSQDIFKAALCGAHSICHLSEDKPPHILTSDNHLLGELEQDTFDIATDNFIQNDTIILHNFNSKLSVNPIPQFDQLLNKLIATYGHYAPNSQADHLLNALAEHIPSDKTILPKLVISIKRIS